MPRTTTTFAQIEHEFMQRISKMVYCNFATVDAQQRPRSRVVHPIWEGTTGWYTTMAKTAKLNQIAANPYVSLAYIAEPFTPVYVECRASWHDDLPTKQRFWRLCQSIPEPLGYDPAVTWGGDIDHPTFSLVRLDAWRIELYDLLHQEQRITWYAEGAAPKS